MQADPQRLDLWPYCTLPISAVEPFDDASHSAVCIFARSLPAFVVFSFVWDEVDVDMEMPHSARWEPSFRDAFQVGEVAGNVDVQSLTVEGLGRFCVHLSAGPEDAWGAGLVVLGDGMRERLLDR